MTPPWLDLARTWAQFWPVGALALIVAALLALLISRPSRSPGRYLFFFVGILALTLLGGVTGKIVGQSRIGVVGAVMPAVLTFLGGLLLYLNQKIGVRKQMFTALGIVGFVICLAIGIDWGATARIAEEERVHVHEENARFLGRLQKEANEERWRDYQKRKQALERKTRPTPPAPAGESGKD